MITEEQIQAVVRRIVEGYQPDRIILFGSYAYGTPTESSDLDLLIIKNDDQRPKVERRPAIRGLLRGDMQSFDTDIATLNRAELQAAAENRFCREYVALRHGRNLYGISGRIAPMAEDAPLNTIEKTTLQRWLNSAEQDFEAARIVAPKLDYYDGVARSCQLSAEKLLKAKLMSLCAIPPSGHDLNSLLAAIARRQDVTAETWRGVEMLAPFATLFHDYFFKSKAAPSIPALLNTTAGLHQSFAPGIRQCLA